MIQIHLAVFLFGFAGLFGKLLTCSPLYIVLGRTFFAAIALWVYASRVSGTALAGFDRSSCFFFILQGILLAVHWITFFLAIQLSSVALGLVTFSSFPLFVTLLEPLVFKEPLQKRDVATALVVFAGIVLVVPDLDFTNHMTLGGGAGILSGLTFAILTLVNRRNARISDPVAVAFYQNLFAALFLVIPVLILKIPVPGRGDLPLLILLGVVFTALAHTLFIQALTRIRAQTASIISGLEPVYGTVLAFLLLREVPRLATVAGGILIIGATLAAGIFSRPPQ